MLDLMVVGDASSVALHVFASAGPNSMVIAFDIYILSHIQPEMWELPFYCRHAGFPVERIVGQFNVSTIEKFDPGNIG